MSYTTNNANVTYTWMNDPFFIGWEKAFSRFNTLKSTDGGFPPYNVIKLADEGNYLVEMAVAGYLREDLEVIEDEGILTVKGERKEHQNEYIHKGIAGRKFTRSFSLGEYVKVKSSNLSDGMLYIILEVEVPENKKPKQIEIH